MARLKSAQVNIRSDFARERVRDIMLRTGMTATAVIEDALRGYEPAVVPGPVAGLVQRGPILIKLAGGRHITHQEAESSLAAVRGR